MVWILLGYVPIREICQGEIGIEWADQGYEYGAPLWAIRATGLTMPDPLTGVWYHIMIYSPGWAIIYKRLP